MTTRISGGMSITLVCWALSGTYAAADTYNPADFATSVVEYVQGAGIPSDFLSGEPYSNPANALGRPAIDTTGDGWAIDPAEHVPVVPIYGPWRASELVSIGRGGHLALKFDRPVTNAASHPFGVDFIIFGNSINYVNYWDSWDNRDPAAMRAGSGYSSPAGLVSVSQDGANWIAFPAGELANRMPSLGRIYDPAHADPAVGAFNQWWGQATDATLPLDPALNIASLSGKSVLEMAQLYGRSAGGAGFDIGELGLDWIQYVRIDTPQDSPLTSIDAVSIVPEPGGPALVGIWGLLLIVRGRRA